MRFRLRTLLIVLALLPPLLAAAWFVIAKQVKTPTELIFIQVFSIQIGLAMAIALAIALGSTVGRIGNAVIAFLEDR